MSFSYSIFRKRELKNFPIISAPCQRNRMQGVTELAGEKDIIFLNISTVFSSGQKTETLLQLKNRLLIVNYYHY